MTDNLNNQAGSQMAENAKNNCTSVYSGSAFGGSCTFYFNNNANLFLCEATFEGKDVKMVGELKGEESKKEAHPRYGIMPEDPKWTDTSGEEVKYFDLTKDEIDMEGNTLKKH